MKALNEIGRNAKEASKELAKLGITQRNNALNKVADALVKRADYIKEPMRQIYLMDERME